MRFSVSTWWKEPETLISVTFSGVLFSTSSISLFFSPFVTSAEFHVRDSKNYDGWKCDSRPNGLSSGKVAVKKTPD